jgi:hypothetical protein
VVLARRPGRPVALYIYHRCITCYVYETFMFCLVRMRTHTRALWIKSLRRRRLEIVKKESQVGNFGLSEWKKEKEDHEILCYTTYNTSPWTRIVIFELKDAQLLFLIT